MKPKPGLVKTDTVEVEVPVQKRLPERLITVEPEPKKPPLNCRDASGRKTVCHKDEANYIDAVRAWGRVLAGKIREIAGLQPKP